MKIIIAYFTLLFTSLEFLMETVIFKCLPLICLALVLMVFISNQHGRKINVKYCMVTVSVAFFFGIVLDVASTILYFTCNIGLYKPVFNVISVATISYLLFQLFKKKESSKELS